MMKFKSFDKNINKQNQNLKVQMNENKMSIESPNTKMYT